jgi:hypothetical protein
MQGLASFSLPSGAGRAHPGAWLSSLRCGRAFALASKPMKAFIALLESPLAPQAPGAGIRPLGYPRFAAGALSRLAASR